MKKIIRGSSERKTGQTLLSTIPTDYLKRILSSIVELKTKSINVAYVENKLVIYIDDIIYEFEEI